MNMNVAVSYKSWTEHRTALVIAAILCLCLAHVVAAQVPAPASSDSKAAHNKSRPTDEPASSKPAEDDNVLRADSEDKQEEVAPAPPAKSPAPAKKTKKIPSLFYTPEEITDIHLAINTYIKRTRNREELTFDEEAFLKRLSSFKKGETRSNYYTYPQFFLDSLVYHSAKDWILWINGLKITQDTPAGFNNLQVLQIDPDRVTIEWMPPTMDKVLEIWNQYPNEEVNVDQLRGKVIFTLRPNQTFSAYVMKVLEGKVLPVTVDLMQVSGFSKSATKDKTTAPALDKPVGSGDSSSNEKEGLPGLINTYQNLGDVNKK